ncbi:MAG: GNAT family N-acetyltransferase [Thermoplasmata archaeon]|nr:GNAT family N-acetyltransferase [Thermoplasmata archaeon]MCI4355976.1 GNAT family N-acetyltransferase [Thermoplasmata archaeon]
MTTPADREIIELAGTDRERAVPVLRDGFTGVYRWHAKKTLGEVDRVRGLVLGDVVVGVTLLAGLVPEVGYVYYVAIATAHRGKGLGGRLLDDAIGLFDQEGRSVVYVATEPENAPMVAALRRRGFREVERKELGFAEGGLGAWGLRSRMTLVWGEILMGRRLRPQPVKADR